MARQFREQLEQEVNAINEVKPVPRHVAPEVGPAAPGTAPAPDIHTASTHTEATGVAEPDATAPNPSAGENPAAPSAPANDVHPEAQIYFAMNGSEPALVTENPYATPSVGEALQAADTGLPAEPGATPAAAKPAESSQPASVEVVFPHDHG